MTGPGRPPAVREVYSFEATGYLPPWRGVFDASFVVEALMSGQKHYRACANALIAMAEAETEFVYSSLLELELYEAGYKVALKERYGRHWARARPDGRARRRAGRLTDGLTRAWSEVLAAVPATTRIEASTVAHRVPALMRRYALGSYDAIHVATALERGGCAVLTLDTGFARVPASQLPIHTVGAKVAGMRAVRAGTR